MKNLVIMFLAFCAACVTFSCTKGKEPLKAFTKPLHGEFTLVGQPDENNVMKYGLNLKDETVLYALYDTLYWDDALNGAVAKKDNLLSFVDSAGKEHSPGGESYDSISLNGDYYRFVGKDIIAYYDISNGRTWGPFDSIVIADNFFFLKEGKSWGLYKKDGTTILDREHSNIYVVSYKSDKDFNVVYQSAEGWSMINAEGAHYDISPALLQKKVEALNLSTNVGKLKIQI